MSLHSLLGIALPLPLFEILHLLIHQKLCIFSFVSKKDVGTVIYFMNFKRMGEKMNAYRILVGKLEGKRLLGRPRHS
jgi:hypothetical protein